MSDAVGARVREIRAARHMTLAELQAATGLTIAQLSKIELGQRMVTADDLLALSTGLRVSLNSLLLPTPAGLWA